MFCCTDTPLHIGPTRSGSVVLSHVLLTQNAQKRTDHPMGTLGDAYGLACISTLVRARLDMCTTCGAPRFKRFIGR